MAYENGIFGCRGVGISFGGRAILRDVSLAVAPGEVLGLVGPNGAGKTSLFEILCGRYTASAGEVFLKDQDITRRAVHDRARLGLARTYQSPVVPQALTIAETFRAARYAYSPYKTRMEAEWACHLANFRQSWDRIAGSLDTFDRRKLLLACLLMRRPAVLLLDEPASGLINSEIDELDLIIRRLVDEYHIAAILIEHRLELLSAIADRTVVLDMGEVIATGTPQEVFRNPRVLAAYFEEPAHG
ncbi:MAG: ABC transporter related protein [uncultured bacterium]|uniref:ABC transporter ATP-binding protein n=1 Tax=Cypionkella sp. TaxID=2811411 RepID=UPI000285E1F9|nr:ATP-binding cassette domain-containing protein [Cypionkella sp.]EKD60246.1 MAG: ABC transporter related protein [uncultured bacterium]KAF0172377.1 MAG: ABC transporter related protein [Paracoccaceae bacterium]MDO8327539.1 ATP-binding cassette domain-containing protein [Cypionkella sp.]